MNKIISAIINFWKMQILFKLRTESILTSVKHIRTHIHAQHAHTPKHPRMHLYNIVQDWMSNLNYCECQIIANYKCKFNIVFFFLLSFTHAELIIMESFPYLFFIFFAWFLGENVKYKKVHRIAIECFKPPVMKLNRYKILKQINN